MMVTIDVNDYIASAAEEIGRDRMSTGVVSKSESYCRAGKTAEYFHQGEKGWL